MQFSQRQPGHTLITRVHLGVCVSLGQTVMTARLALKAAPAGYNPCKARAMMARCPVSAPSSGPGMFHTFSVTGAVMCAFITSPALTFSSFGATKVSAVCTVLRHTTLEWVMHLGPNFHMAAYHS